MATNDKLAWLLESKHPIHKPNTYYKGLKQMRILGLQRMVADWTENANEALQFTSRTLATDKVTELKRTHNVLVVAREHVFE